MRVAVVNAVTILGQGFLDHPANGPLTRALREKTLPPADYYRELLWLIHRLLSLIIAEGREVLPPGTEGNGHPPPFTRHLRQLAAAAPGPAEPNHYEAWKRATAPYGGLFEPGYTPFLNRAVLADGAWQDAVRSLLTGTPGPFDFASLGPEELGGLHEHLLAFKPDFDPETARFVLAPATDHARKASGTYYTPPRLVNRLLDASLTPLLDEAASRPDPEAAILGLRICDPACGVGHFLTAAARRMAERLAAHRTGEVNPAANSIREALRDIIPTCLYGVDLDPIAVELCRAALGREAHAPGRPLAALGQRVQWGNALLGATAEQLSSGIPDEAFEAREGDDPKIAAAWKRQNERERRDFTFVNHVSEHDQTRADLWCAAFVQRQSPENEHPITTARLAGDLARQPETLTAAVERLASTHRLFHWHLRFPEIAHRGGFDLVLGNPPWVSYTGRQGSPLAPDARRLLIALNPATARWPSTHAAFLVLAVRLTRPGGRVGLVLPRQVAEQTAYAGARHAVEELGGRPECVQDVGEESFPGINQAVGLFTLSRDRREVREHSLQWPIQRVEPQPSAGHVFPDPARTESPLKPHREFLGTLPRFPARTFFDPGVHTGNVSRKVIVSERPPDGREWAPVREGRDLTAYGCGLARKWVAIDAPLEPGEYYTVRPRDLYFGTPILLRQTANRPIAARHVERTYFRNSLLACRGVAGVSDALLVACLNSALFAHLHRLHSQDANQKAFPQVKIQHLQSLPLFDPANLHDVFEGKPVSLLLEEAAGEAEADVSHGKQLTREALLRLERLVLTLYGLPVELAVPLLETC